MRGIPRDAFSFLGNDIPRDSNYPGTTRYYLYGIPPPRDVFVRERDVHFSVARGSGDNRVCAGRVFVRALEIAFYHGNTGFPAGFDCRVVPSDAFTHLARNMTRFISLSLFVRDVFSVGTGYCNLGGTRVCGSGIYTFPWRGSRILESAPDFLYGHGISDVLRDHGIIPNPVQNRGMNPAGNIRRGAPAKMGPLFSRHKQRLIDTVHILYQSFFWRFCFAPPLSSPKGINPFRAAVPFWGQTT